MASKDPLYDLPVIPFKDAASLRKWFVTHHMRAEGFWLRLMKKGSGKAGVTYAEALDEALCHGWIDGMKRTYDDESYVIRVTPRRERSVWSEANKAHVARLIKEKRMTKAGLAAVDVAKADGRWDGAYESQATAETPADFLLALAKDKKGLAYYESLPKSAKYTVYWRLKTAKTPETRAKRMTQLLHLFSKGMHPHDTSTKKVKKARPQG